MTISAPAKINLSLRVVGRREDGFHDIDTVVVKLPGLADELVISESESFSFTCDTPGVPTDDSNLVVKALHAFETAAGITCTLSISLKKTIPHGAGLGGGSSDAAMTLKALNEIYGAPLGPDELHSIAASLGSDIPLFLMDGAVRCTGRGEILEPVPSPPALPIVLLKPSFPVATPDAYKRWQDSIELPGVTYAAQSVNGITLVNDLERPVFQKHRFLAEMKMWLLARKEVSAAMMSGSGSTMIAVLRDPNDSARLISAALTELDPHLWAWSGWTDG